jgi:hypothetical protein
MLSNHQVRTTTSMLLMTCAIFVAALSFNGSSAGAAVPPEFGGFYQPVPAQPYSGSADAASSASQVPKAAVAAVAASDAAQKTAGDSRPVAAVAASDAAQKTADDSRPVATDPMAQYYASFGDTKPLTHSAPASAGSDDDSPWLWIGIALGAALLIAGTGGGIERRRRTHHRQPVTA